MDSLPSDAVGFTRKRHQTPHTVPRTRLPAGTPMAERLAMESLRQQLSFEEEAEVCLKVLMESLSKMRCILLIKLFSLQQPNNISDCQLLGCAVKYKSVVV